MSGRKQSNRSLHGKLNDKGLNSTRTQSSNNPHEFPLPGNHDFISGAVRSADADDVRLDLICPTGLLRLAAIYKEGSDKYGDTNWCRGIPISNLLNHLKRHLSLWEKGDREEDHLAKVAWGVFGIMHYQDKCTHHEVILLNQQQDKEYLKAQQFDFLQGDPTK